MREAWIAFVLVLVLLVGSCLGEDNGRTAPNGSLAINATIVEPDDGSQPIVELIDRAASSIDVAVYLLSDSDVIEALRRARQRKVNVRVMLEENPFGGGQSNRNVYRRLTDSDIEVKWANPVFRYSHQKIILVDRRKVAIMTLNLTRSAFVRNREFAVIGSDRAEVAELQALFEADWERGPYKPTDPDLVISPDNSRPKLLALIAQAKRTLDIYAEEMNEREIEAALIAAAKSGVRVRLIMSPAEPGERDLSERGRSDLKQGGVAIRLLERPYVHAKAMVVDGRLAFVGSQNFTATSLDHNREVGLIIAQPNAIEKISAAFEKDWASLGKDVM